MSDTEVTDYYDLDTDTGFIYVRPRPTQAIIDEVIATVSIVLGVQLSIEASEKDDVLEMSLKTRNLEVIGRIGGIATTTIVSLEHAHGTNQQPS